MNIALAGAHRTGKSTLARAVAEKLGIAYVPSRASEIFRSMDLRVGERLDFGTRLAVQERILESHIADLRATGGSWIADRSTLDMAAYTLSEAGDATPEEAERAVAYVRRCILEANRLYGSCTLIQPGIPYVAEEGKPPPNAAKQELLNATIWGLLADPEIGFPTLYLQRGILDLEERVGVVLSTQQALVQRARAYSEGAVIH